MDRIDMLHGVIERHGVDVFHAREGKIRKVLSETALTFADVEELVAICSADRRLVKRILSEPDISKTRDEQKMLVNAVDGRSIAALKDVHTACYNYGERSISRTDGEFDDGKYVYTIVPARKQCLNLVRPAASAGYDLDIPDTVTIDRKEYKVVSLADGCFEGNRDIVSVSLPAGLETIGRNAFCNCSSLSRIELPRHLKSIGDNAFAYTAVESVVFQGYLEEVGNMAFYTCRGLRTVEISKRTGQIGLGAFAGCSSLETFTVSDKNGRFMFQDGVLYSRKQDRIVQVAGTFRGKLSPPRSVLTVEQYAAEDCVGITELDLPLSVTSLGAYAFKGCTGIAKAKFPTSLERIGEGTFEGCTSLRTIDVPDSVKVIGKGAFRNCTSLETGEIAGTVRYRDQRIFEGCTGLNRITIRKNSEHVAADFPKNTRVKFTHE
ncbi:MAG: leucine-rich repeat domain-containing protein [archaeon]|nr:leucine-rich repeat domain-containing protein [archaeon]